eukprot:m.66278 g.66278  ORF g.66278 m.66278 type:complete len:1520 (+) comp35377_c0_seq1:125-4684(+)
MDHSRLPHDVKKKLAELDEELAEGDITEKGYEKKKAKLLAPYATPTSSSGGMANSNSTSSFDGPMSPTGPVSSPLRRETPDQLPRTASGRIELVKDALRRRKPHEVPLPMPSKRTSHADLSVDLSRGRNRQGNFGRLQYEQAETGVYFHQPSPRTSPAPEGSPASDLQRQELAAAAAAAAAASVQPVERSRGGKTFSSVRVKRNSDEEVAIQAGQGKVSAKIQQLLNTLKRPKKKKKNKEDYYTEDVVETTPEDPHAPKPIGPMIEPAAGETFQVDSSLPRNIEAAIARLGSVSQKAPCISTVDMHGKPQVSLTYGKLSSRSQKVCYSLLNKVGGTKADPGVKQGERVALLYSANEAGGLCAGFFGCLFAGVVPVAIDPPLSKEDTNIQQIGFLLGSLGISVALTNEATMKLLPRDESSKDIVQFKGWPKLTWFVTENLPRPNRDWSPPPRPQPESPAYVEYVENKDGSMMGVTVTRASMLNHCRMLSASCGFREGQTVVCAVNHYREVGLWYGILTAVYVGLHSIFVPSQVVAAQPIAWIHMITKNKAIAAVVNSRALAMASTRPGKEYKDCNFSNLRLLLISDGASPWSLHACDTFLDVFKSKGAHKEMVCPCASSSETLTIGMRRPGLPGSTATGRGIMSITGLSYGVVRVEEENSNSSLTLQDCGTVLPGAKVAVVKLEGQPFLCQTDEVGELCVFAPYCGSGYWGLAGKTTTTFKVQPLLQNGKPHSQDFYVRTGLLGFLGPGGLIFVCGRLDGLLKVARRKHNTDDLIATILAVEPHRFVYRQRIAIFSFNVWHEERIVVVAEQRPGCSEEEAFQWMSSVLPAVETIHNLHLYALVLLGPNTMPLTHHKVPNVLECKQRFTDGSLHPVNLLMSPHQCVTNLPQPKSREAVSAAAQLMVDLVTGQKLACSEGKRLEPMAEDRDGAGKFQFLSEVLKWRAQTNPDHQLFSLLNEKGGIARSMTCSQLLKRAERIGATVMEKAGLSTGDHVALLFYPGIELIVSFYGCLITGLIPVTIRPPNQTNISSTLPTVKMVLDVSKARAIVTTRAITKLLKTKEAASSVDLKGLPPLVETDDTPKRKLDRLYRAPTSEMMAYVDFSVSTTGVLSGVKMSHLSATNVCRSLKMANELYPSRTVCLCLDPYSGLGFILWVLSSVYSGHHSILVPPSELEANPSLWLSAVSNNKVRDTYCSYSVMNLCTQELGGQTEALRAKINLSCVRTCVVVAEERPRVFLTSAFSALFAPLGLSGRAVSTSFGCRVNVAICAQGSSQPEPTSVFVDSRSLRVDRVSLVEKGSPHSLCLLECGKILPGIKLAVVHPDSRQQCHSTELGEVWVSGSHNGSGYFGLSANVSDSLTADYFRVSLPGDSALYGRTGYLGFLKQADKSALDGSSLDSLFIVGSLDEAMTVREMRYYPIDIETTVVRCHKAICGCAVFTWTKLLVVVVELAADESEALDVVPVVTSAVLEDQQLIVGIVVVVDPGVIPINSRGERQRMHLRDGFLADELDPIYVAYNM